MEWWDHGVLGRWSSGIIRSLDDGVVGSWFGTTGKELVDTVNGTVVQGEFGYVL